MTLLTQYDDKINSGMKEGRKVGRGESEEEWKKKGIKEGSK